MIIQENFDPNWPDETGQTALHYAILYGAEPNIIRSLLEGDADPNLSNIDGKTAHDLARDCALGDAVLKNLNSYELKRSWQQIWLKMLCDGDFASADEIQLRCKINPRKVHTPCKKENPLMVAVRLDKTAMLEHLHSKVEWEMPNIKSARDLLAKITAA